MWLIGRTDPKAMAVARSLGLQLTDEQLYGEDGTSLKDCVVDFGDYCSGVIVSSDGLVFTNHHCGYSAIQKLSTPEDDILDNGFVAKTHADERPAEGLFVKVWQRTQDITAEITDSLRRLYADKDLERKAGKNREAVIYSKNISRLLSIAARRAERTAKRDGEKGIVCDAKAFYGGSVFLINYYRKYSDIRLVFTVPQCLGNFGGDTDNWMWPRQTADFSVFRIYADSLGNPASYSAENIPLQPKRWARVSIDGYDQGSYCMTIGYPGSTSRYLSSYGIEERTTVNNIPVIQVRGVKQDVWKKWMRADRAISIKYSSKFAQSSNYWKNSQGMNEAVARLGIISQKQQREQNIQRWYEADKSRKQRFGSMLSTLKKAYKERHDAQYAQGFANETFNRGIEIVSFARLAVRCAESHTNYRAVLEEYVSDSYKDYDPRVDEEVMAALLENYAKQVSSKYLPRFYSDIRKKYKNDYKAFAHDIFAQSRLTSYKGWYGLVHAKVRSAKTLPDSLEQALADEQAYLQHVNSDPAVRLYTQIADMTSNVISPSLTKTAPVISYNENLLTQSVLEMEQEEPHYSDANFTQRMSFGIVSDYTNAGTHHDLQTTMPSLLAKIDRSVDIDDYKVTPDVARILRGKGYGRYADSRTRDLNLCFLTTNDITGGNSGSPMFNGRGELIGLAFDGNWDALSSDISFDSGLTRCIGVDIRYVLWLMERWGNAYHLVNEVLK